MAYLYKQFGTPFNILLLLSICYLCACNHTDLPTDVAAAYRQLPAKLDFNIHVKPVLSDKCFACHGPDKGKIEAGLQLHASETALSELAHSKGKYAIVPYNTAKSELVDRILNEAPEYTMPPPEFKLTLSAHEKAILVKWIEQGAAYEPHWAFQPPTNQPLPKSGQAKHAENPIDKFIYQKLAEKELSPSKIAEKSVLLRRLSLDLTGLPPTSEEIKSFINDNSPSAFEKQVDRLLSSPHYGEKMAVDWLDVARYADTYGYQVDFYRDMSPWREWVINAFNQNLPYDEFITWQIAGDMLPNATKDQLLATGFNRLHSQNSEDGIVEEEYRVEHVVDRTSTLGTGIMGLTIACARCHDHKYDPISQKEFYELYSFFNNINESGQISRDPMDMPVPTMLVTDEEKDKVLALLDRQVKTKEKTRDSLLLIGDQSAKQWITNEGYHALTPSSFQKNKAAFYSLDGHLKNSITGLPGKMAMMYMKAKAAKYDEGFQNKGLKLNGDSWLDLEPIGIYKSNEPFSIGLTINIPDSLEEGVIFHKNKGVRLHGYKGYHLYFKDKKLEIMMAHTWPDNAIIKQSKKTINTGEWVQITMTYDGSGKANGINLYIDGELLPMDVLHDNLYKDIIFHNYEDPIYPKPIEPGLKIGGRWRGFGLKNAIVDNIFVYDRELVPLEILGLFNMKAAMKLVSKPATSLTIGEKTMLSQYYSHRLFGLEKVNDDLKLIRQALVDSLDQLQEVMVMKEMTTPRQAYILIRGQYDNYGEKVYPNTPNSILAMPDDLPKNRLGLARWLTHPDHPLTARVAVNRFWQNYFGQGIVKTAEDFGNQGALPSHPALLDWLALSFSKSGWDIKAMQKLIVMSQTYQQSSTTTSKLMEIDPDNTFLARGPKMRLSSEMIRDNALAASNLLVKKIGGESVKPYQPEGLWKMNGHDYVPDTGENLYRRSLYTLWKRTVPFPTQATFDQPDRNECTMKRQKTNTPLQALVLLNDPTFIEASRKIGESITKSGNNPQAIKSAFLELTGRYPTSEELNVLVDLQQHEYEKFKLNPAKTKGWLESGAYRIDKNLDTNLVAANAVVASVMLNTDAFITKR